MRFEPEGEEGTGFTTVGEAMLRVERRRRRVGVVGKLVRLLIGGVFIDGFEESSHCMVFERC